MNEEDYPEHVKLARVRDHSQTLGEFLEWTGENGWFLVKGDDESPNGFVPVGKSCQTLVAEFFGINLIELSKEKGRMLEAIRHNLDNEKLRKSIVIDGYDEVNNEQLETLADQRFYPDNGQEPPNEKS